MKNIIVIFSLLLLSGCASNPGVVRNAAPDVGPARHQVYVVSHGWHTGFVVPASPLQDAVPQLEQRFPSAPYIEIGWGDKGFYQAKEITSGLTLQAMFWRTDSVIHAVSVPANPDKYFKNSEVERLCLSDSQLSSLIRFITDSFHKEADGSVVPVKNGLYGDSQFYRGVGYYYLMNTCNTWTAKGLYSAGMDISPTFTLSASGVMDYLRDNAGPATVRTATQAAGQSSCATRQATLR